MIYVLIPAFNEAPNLETLLPRIPERALGRPISTVVICDGSTDGTCRVSAAHGAEVVKLSSNHGKGSAVRAGAALLNGRAIDAVVTMDGDGQHNPDDLTTLIGQVLAGQCDVVIGSRCLTDPGKGRTPLNRFLVRTAFTRLLRHRLRQPVTDPFTGYRCMSPRAFEAVLLRGDRYEGELEVRFEAERIGLDVIEVPIERIYDGGQSKMTATGGRLRVIRGYARAIIETHSHILDDFSEPIMYGGRIAHPTTIGGWGLIGYNAVILAGVTIGERVVVGSNSVVTKDVADYHIVGGVPAKTIKVVAPPD